MNFSRLGQVTYTFYSSTSSVAQQGEWCLLHSAVMTKLGLRGTCQGLRRCHLVLFSQSPGKAHMFWCRSLFEPLEHLKRLWNGVRIRLPGWWSVTMVGLNNSLQRKKLQLNGNWHLLYSSSKRLCGNSKYWQPRKTEPLAGNNEAKGSEFNSCSACHNLVAFAALWGSNQ